MPDLKSLGPDARVAVIGASGGIGDAFCRALADSDRVCLVHALSRSGAGPAGDAIHCSTLDLSDEASIAAAAERVSATLGDVEHKVVTLNLDSIGGSALTDDIDVPEEETSGIPVTYVPARNTVFLSFALAWAEVLQSSDIFIGVNAVDYSGYPDCRPEYIAAFENLAGLATKGGVEGGRFHIHAPLIKLSKAEIIREGQRLGIDYANTVSCYAADEAGRACGLCDACRLRAQGFHVVREEPDHPDLPALLESARGMARACAPSVGAGASPAAFATSRSTPR